jgi:hypothetical protein
MRLLFADPNSVSTHVPVTAAHLKALAGACDVVFLHPPGFMAEFSASLQIEDAEDPRMANPNKGGLANVLATMRRLFAIRAARKRYAADGIFFATIHPVSFLAIGLTARRKDGYICFHHATGSQLDQSRLCAMAFRLFKNRVYHAYGEIFIGEKLKAVGVPPSQLFYLPFPMQPLNADLPDGSDKCRLVAVQKADDAGGGVRSNGKESASLDLLQKKAGGAILPDGSDTDRCKQTSAAGAPYDIVALSGSNWTENVKAIVDYEERHGLLRKHGLRLLMKCKAFEYRSESLVVENAFYSLSDYSRLILDSRLCLSINAPAFSVQMSGQILEALSCRKPVLGLDQTGCMRDYDQRYPNVVKALPDLNALFEQMIRPWTEKLSADAISADFDRFAADHSEIRIREGAEQLLAALL